MYASKFLVLLALLVLPAQVIACENSESFRYTDGDKERSCRNIRNDETRRQLLCKDAAVNAACPQTCGTCCEDVSTYKFNRDNGMEGTCAWLGETGKEHRIKKYCVDQATVANNGRTVRDGCPVTCSMCKTAVSSVTTVPTISSAPSKVKSAAPTGQPSSAPTGKPSASPTGKPSISPTDAPSRPPSPQPSPFPTSRPTFKPSQSPSRKPSQVPSKLPSLKPSQVPSNKPSLKPSQAPSRKPSQVPSKLPSLKPSAAPSRKPSQVPSKLPSLKPSQVPSRLPSLKPSAAPSRKPSQVPSRQPSNKPTSSIKPSASPSKKPSAPPNPSPSKKPSSAPSKSPVAAPTPIVTSCVNTSYKFPLINDPTQLKGCLWIIQNGSSVQTRRDNYCGNATIKVNCVQACGLCTTPTDSPDFTFKLKKQDIRQDCGWITKNASKISIRKDYCSRANVNAGCRGTCAGQGYPA